MDGVDQRHLVLRIALIIVVVSASPALAQVTLVVDGAHDGLTLDRVVGARRALQRGRYGSFQDVDVVEPVCFVPCVAHLPAGSMDISLSRPGMHPSRVGERLTLASDAFIRVALDDRSALRVAGWVTWITSFVAGLGIVIGGAVAHDGEPTLVTGFVLVGVGAIVGIALAAVGDATSVRVEPFHDVPEAEQVGTAGPDVIVANEAVAACSDVGGALIHAAISAAGRVVRSTVLRVGDDARRCVESALARADFARGASRQVHVEVEEAGARTNDPDTLRAALAECPSLPPDSSVVVSVETDGSVSDVASSGVEDEHRSCVEASLRRARFLPRERALDIHLALPAAADDASAIPPPPRGVEASVLERVEERHAAIAACAAGRIVTLVVDWTSEGAITVSLDDAHRGTAAEACIARATHDLALDVAPGAPGHVLHAVQ